MKLDESKYPMTYEEYEKRVVELFLEQYDDDVSDLMSARLEQELSLDPNYIHGFYGHDCWVYDNPDLYGNTCKDVFEDKFLKQTPVANLRKLLE